MPKKNSNTRRNKQISIVVLIVLAAFLIGWFIQGLIALLNTNKLAFVGVIILIMVFFGAIAIFIARRFE